MNKSIFNKLADEEIEAIYFAIENSPAKDLLESDILDEILTIDVPGQMQYVINKHNYAMQIWLSSPFSGAYHFSYDPNSLRWKDRNYVELRDLLARELLPIAGEILLLKR